MTQLVRSLLVNIDVPDVEAATRFYVETFELVVNRRLGGAGVELLVAGSRMYLLLKAEGSPPFAGAASARSYGRHWTPVHLDFEVSDIEATRNRALSNGATSESDITEHAFGRMALLADPFGHGLCLIELNARGYDALV
jgi:predicted enzyme related to lactoylglutathione lyase